MNPQDSTPRQWERISREWDLSNRKGFQKVRADLAQLLLALKLQVDISTRIVGSLQEVLASLEREL